MTNRTPALRAPKRVFLVYGFNKKGLDQQKQGPNLAVKSHQIVVNKLADHKAGRTHLQTVFLKQLVVVLLEEGLVVDLQGCSPMLGSKDQNGVPCEGPNNLRIALGGLDSSFELGPWFLWAKRTPTNVHQFKPTLFEGRTKICSKIIAWLTLEGEQQIKSQQLSGWLSTSLNHKKQKMQNKKNMFPNNNAKTRYPKWLALVNGNLD